MPWVTWFLFEQPAALASPLFVVNFVLLVHWRRSGRGRPLLVGLLVAVVLLVVQALVVTRREQALRILGGIAQDVVSGGTAHLEAALAPDFQAHGMGREAFLADVRRKQERVHVRTVWCTQLRVRRSEADRFTVWAAYDADVTGEEYGGRVPTGWEITFVHGDAGWQLQQVRLAYLAGLRDPAWGALGGP